MDIRCLLGHEGASPTFNAGIVFSECARCRSEVIRRPGGRWYPLPKGFRVAWKKDGAHAISADRILGVARRQAPVLHKLVRRKRQAMYAYFNE
jgi:hypothetical protein